MKLKDFPYPKLNLPIRLKLLEKDSEMSKFQPITDYIHLVSDFIYTDIDITGKDSSLMHAWVLRVISSNLIRSLYIRNSFVDGVNSRNIYSMQLASKALFETVGLLASILDLIEKNDPPEVFMSKLEPYALGNRAKGDYMVGNVEAINVATLIEKADKYFTKFSKEIGVDFEKNFFINFYDNSSSASHPCYDSYEYIGTMNEGTWSAFSIEVFKEQLLTRRYIYIGAQVSQACISNICKKIFAKYCDEFKRVSAVKFFD